MPFFQKTTIKVQEDNFKYIVMLLVAWGMFSASLSLFFVFNYLETFQDFYPAALKGLIIFTLTLLVGVGLFLGCIALVLRFFSKSL